MENSTFLSVACILHALFSGLLSQKISPPIIRRDGGCYSANEIREIGQQVVLEALQFKEVPDCGKGLWKQVISLNMSNAEETCPVGWILSSNPRSCSQTTAPGCSLTTISTETVYQRVCGRALGHASGTTDAFKNSTSARTGFNYADGVNLFLATTTPTHVWTLAADYRRHTRLPRCPCNNQNNHPFPDYVGTNYFCDTHEASNVYIWDGVGCSAEACCDYNNPPWFNVAFNSTFTSDLQARICSDESFSNEKINLIELELYVQ